MLLFSIISLLCVREDNCKSVNITNGTSGEHIKTERSISTTTAPWKNERTSFRSDHETSDFTRPLEAVSNSSKAKRDYLFLGHSRAPLKMIQPILREEVRSSNNFGSDLDWPAHTTLAANGTLCPNHCKCTKVNETFTMADCSSGSLRHIPEFESDVTYINLHNNLIKKIDQSVKLPSKITYLDLSKNNIRLIAEGIFQGLHSLRYLDISMNNDLSLVGLKNVTSGLNESDIKVLKFNEINCDDGVRTQVKRSYLINLQNTTLEDIYCEANMITTFEDDVIRNLPSSVKLLSLSYNRLSFGGYWFEFFKMPNIREIRLTGMSFIVNPLTSVFVPCRILSFLSVIRGGHLNFTLYLPETLEVIDFRKTIYRFDNFTSNMFMHTPNLRTAYYEGNYFRELYYVGMYRNKTETVQLSNNFCTYISPEHFTRAVNMKKLYLDNNFLGEYLSRKEASNLFRNQEKLQVLDLSQNRIEKLTKSLFSRNHRLTHLNLSFNMLSKIKFDIGHMMNLRILNLTQNRIKFLSQRSRLQLDFISRDHNVTMDLTGNYLFCNCDTMDFLRWIQRHTRDGSIIFPNYKSYKCTYTNSSEVFLHDIDTLLANLKLQCSSKMGLIVGCVLCVVIFISTVLLSVLYRYRWKVRYLYFTTKRALSNVQSQDHKIYRYNVFLSYAEEDKDLAIEVILPYLENEGSMKICCHTRDFTPGRSIADNITIAIHDSHFTVCIISGHYLKSYWCMYEFNLAKMESLYARGGQEVLFLILCQDINSNSIPLNIMHHIESKCYLEVPPDDDEASKDAFLQRLRTTLS